MKSTKAFTLIETLIAMVIGVISVAAISYSYIYFNNTYQNILDKANMSGTFLSVPDREEMQVMVNEQLIVELYSK